MYKCLSLVAVLLFGSAGCLYSAAPESLADRSHECTGSLCYDSSRGGGVFGPTVAVDLGFDYYRRTAPEVVARKIREAGCTAVHVVESGTTITSRAEMKRFIAAFRAEKLAPVLEIYAATCQFMYEAHPDWRQRLLTGLDAQVSWRTYLCPNRAEFVKAYCDHVEDLVRVGGFDGATLAEIWFEQDTGPELKGRVNPSYACICDACIARYRTMGGTDPVDMLTSPGSPRYFRRPENAKAYAKWIEMRVDTIQDFGSAIIGAVRRGNPKATINAMYVSDLHARTGTNRDNLGCDFDRILREWRPDILTVQDAWQDWMVPGLTPEYVKRYAQAYVPRARRILPGVFLMTHSDIGSIPESKRSPEWIRSLTEIAMHNGFGGTCFYEWSISRWAE